MIEERPGRDPGAIFFTFFHYEYKNSVDIVQAVCYNTIVPKERINERRAKPMGKKKKRRKARLEMISIITALISSVAALIAAVASLLKD